FSVNVHEKVWLAPPGMVTGVSGVAEDAPALPLTTVTAGGLGEEMTTDAAAPPVFVTTRLAVKVPPRSTADGMVNEVTESEAGFSTCATVLLPLPVEMVPPVLASVPVAAVASRREPVPVPFSV